MLGSGFPSTGQEKETELPRDTLSFPPLPVADGESEKKKRKTMHQKINGYSSGLIAYKWEFQYHFV